MKAILFRTYGGPEVMELAEVEAPRLRDPGEVLIDVAAASIIPGDCKLRAGALRALFPISLPKRTGRDGAGIVRAVGDAVRDVAPGDRVCFSIPHTETGCQAEQVVCRAEALVPVPPTLSLCDAAALTHAGLCAWLSIHDTLALRPGQTVLIQGGSGAIGGVAVQLAALAGARVLATCRAANRDRVAALGAAATFAHDEGDPVAEILRQYGPVDAALDLVGGAAHAQCCAVLRRGGRLAYLLAHPFEDVSGRHGVTLMQVPIREDRAALHGVMDLAGRGRISPMVSGTVSPAEIVNAHRRMDRGEVSGGRLVIVFGDPDAPDAATLPKFPEGQSP